MDGARISSPRGPLADFLSARRAAVAAADHGLPEPAYPRRVPGLRREEVAQLAGISTDYYSRLEQGRVRTASRAVLAAIARALLLNDEQQRHLFLLAHPEVKEQPGETEQRITPQTVRLLANLIDTAALVFGRDRRGGPVLLGLAPGQPGGDGGAVAVPGRRRASAPQLGERGADLGVGDLGERPVATEPFYGAVDGRGVGAVGVGVGGARGGQESVGGRGEGDAFTAKGGDLRRGAHAGRRATFDMMYRITCRSRAPSRRRVVLVAAPS
ncbi:helix-turn-helix domain-containing protein [Nonomuraea sp. GTA35]|uniref:helix-turn-helix domain-containing protein n=1 Tax=Nonomuraea sp. GTA35 TaxID=1676746 RepID=UPI0035C1BA70